MSQSFLSVACAGLLLAAGAFAASESAGPDAVAAVADVAASAGVPGAPAPARAKAATHVVRVFVTVRDATGKEIAKPGVRIEGDDAVDIGVGTDGAKLSLPVNAAASLRVLLPGGNCSVSLSPASVASGSVTIVVARGDAGVTCGVGNSVAAGAAASSPASAASVPSASHGGAVVMLIDRLF